MAQWIGGGRLLGRRFHLSGAISSALIRISGLGYFVLQVNGKRVGNDHLVPVESNFEQVVFYLEYELAPYLHEGENEITVALGEGFFAQSLVLDRHGWAANSYGALRMYLEGLILMQNGSVLSLDSNLCQWQVLPRSPYVADNIYAGEFFDNRLRKPDWSSALPVVAMDGPGGVLAPQPIDGETIVRNLTAKSITILSGGRAIYDFGENISGWGHLQVCEPAGTQLVMRYGEEVDQDGEVDFASTGVFATHHIQTDRYICSGEKLEEYHPEFTYHGFRYIELSGWTVTPDKNTLSADFVRSKLTRTGWFDSSDSWLNQLYAMAARTLDGNLHSFPTDCPAREKCGWLGDAQVLGEWASFQLDLRAFWAKYENDIATSAIDGLPTHIAPGLRRCGIASPAWGIASVVIPYLSYRFYGDRQILSDHYPMMTRWVEHLLQKSENRIVSHGLGDWCPPGSCHPVLTPVPLTSTVMFFESAQLVSEIAGILGNSTDCRCFEELSQEIKQAFITTFFDSASGHYGSQSANVLALKFNLIPAGEGERVLAGLLADLKSRDWHFSCGILGMRYLFEVLAAAGEIESVWKIIHADGYPGFRDIVGQGATTFWETWEKNPVDEPTPRSRNHPMQTGFATLFFEVLGGIQLDRDFADNKTVVINPAYPADLNHCHVRFQSIHGMIEVKWHRVGEEIKLDVRAPKECNLQVVSPPSKLG